VQSLVPILSHSLGEDVIVRMTLADDLPSVHADPGQLEQVIMNLAANARDAMPRGGTLVFGTRLAVCDHDRSPFTSAETVVPRAVLSVSDTGVGMEPSVAARVFEPFFTTKDPGRGTGLGLSTVYGIVKQSGGTITLDTKPGQGATFSICLPIDADEPEHARPRIAATQSRRTSHRRFFLSRTRKPYVV
jgi:Signal transduction histidine kinase